MCAVERLAGAIAVNGEAERLLPRLHRVPERLVDDPQLRELGPFPGEFERDLLRERVKSGLAAARARGKVLGRRKGFPPKSDKLAPKVLKLVDGGIPIAPFRDSSKSTRTRYSASCSEQEGREPGPSRWNDPSV